MKMPPQEDPGPRTGWEDSPIKLLIVLIFVIVSTECLITFAVGRLLPGLPMVAEIVLDSVLLVGILFPTLYLLIFTPLVHSTSERRSAELALMRDIARRKEAEERLKISLQHKEMLIKEIDHRVKNNLQLISGLLRLQEKYYTDQYHVGLLHDCQHRVSALATLYEMLSDSADLTSINFTDFTKRLLAYLYPACGVDSTKVIPAVASGDIRLDIDTAIPCALILNELISNTLKYAFPDGRRGRLTISLEQRSDDGMVLLVKDDGVGFAPAIDFYQSPSLGLRLVRLLAEQLDGTSDHSGDNGTAITINFRRASALENNRIYDNSAHTGS